MNEITIRRAGCADVSSIEDIYQDCVRWTDQTASSLWTADDMTWEKLSTAFHPGDFHIAFLNKKPAGCMILLDHDPFFWPDVKKGRALFIHKLAVCETARKTGLGNALINYAKGLGLSQGADAIRLDCDASRDKLRAFYERHGFSCVREKTYADKNGVPKYRCAFYVFDLAGMPA